MVYRVIRLTFPFYSPKRHDNGKVILMENRLATTNNSMHTCVTEMFLSLDAHQSGEFVEGDGLIQMIYVD